MESAQIPALHEPPLAAMPQLREKPHLGFSSKNPALHQVHEACNSTTALGFRAALHLERIRSRYTGKERDNESGLDYFGARYLASSMGRWTSPDPLEWLDWQNGDDEEKARFRDYINNPQHFDMYAYVLNNPLSLTDPDGEAELNKEQMEKIIKESLAKATNAQTKAVDTGKLASEILKALPTDCTVKGSTLAAALKDTGVKLDGAVGSALNSANTISKSGNTVTIQSSKVTDVSVVGGTTVHIAPTVSFNIGSNAGGTTLSNITGISATSKIGFKNVTVPVTGLLITSSKTTATYRALGFDHKKDF